MRDSGILVGGEKEEEKVKAEKIRRAVASSQVTATFGSDREHYLCTSLSPFFFLLYGVGDVLKPMKPAGIGRCFDEHPNQLQHYLRYLLRYLPL